MILVHLMILEHLVILVNQVILVILVNLAIVVNLVNLVILVCLVILVILANLAILLNLANLVILVNLCRNIISGILEPSPGTRRNKRQTEREDGATQPLGCRKAEFRKMSCLTDSAEDTRQPTCSVEHWVGALGSFLLTSFPCSHCVSITFNHSLFAKRSLTLFAKSLTLFAKRSLTSSW